MILLLVLFYSAVFGKVEEGGDSGIVETSCGFYLANQNPTDKCYDDSCECALCKKDGKTYCIDAVNNGKGFDCPTMEKKVYEKCVEDRTTRGYVLIGSIAGICLLVICGTICGGVLNLLGCFDCCKKRETAYV